MTKSGNIEEIIDTLVVGGGVNGVGVAVDAAGRGLSVLLCEKGDLAGATSSSSSKLIHGGLRYLEHYKFRLVKEALVEREVLLKKAPHIMWPMRFRLPHQKHLRPAWMIHIGMFLYDSLATRNIFPSSKKRATSSHGPLVDTISTCFEYSDGWVDDARLVVLNAIAARDKGADIHTRTECVGAQRQGNLWLVTLRDESGKTFTVRTKSIVNATGPWALSFLERLVHVSNPHTMRMVKGSHLIVPKLYNTDEAYVLQNKDRRIVFVIPYEDKFSLVGTTDEDFIGNPSDAAISDEETEYLIKVVNEYFKTKISCKDIVHNYSGVRPLLKEKNASAQELSRDYKIELEHHAGEPVLLNVFGGKITTYRKLAEHAVDKLAACFPKASRAWTKDVPLPGGAFESHERLIEQLTGDFPWLPVPLAQRYAKQYGLLCLKFLKHAKSLDNLGADFGAMLYQAEVDYLIANEWAKNVDDVIWRRTKHGLRLSKQEKLTLADYVSQAVYGQSFSKENI